LENIIRGLAAFGILALMLGWERLRPRRKPFLQRQKRWPVNLGLGVLNMIVMRLTIGSLAYLSALYAQSMHVGLLNQWPLAAGIKIAATLLALDFAVYCQHIATHKWPLLWRLHRIHHTDLDFDATTALRFHPFEIIASMLYKGICILLLGAQPEAVIAFEIILNGASTFNHGNVYLPETLDRYLRWLIITPDMHRVHHSIEPDETDSNYGFSISWWDRLFNTYRPAPKQGQMQMTIGLKQYRQAHAIGFRQLLKLPFIK
jgi:sterol desaturase/sphingolipid hydroxylase (fatty acid hydroxylase superfamily)